VTIKVDDLRPVYFPHRVDVDLELFSPVASYAQSFDCMSGYFSSGVLRELAHAVSFYLLSSDDRTMRFIIGPNIASDADFRALQEGVERQDNLIPLLFGDFDISVENLKTNTVQMLSYLVSTGKLELKVAVMAEAGGIFHQKVWLFETQQGSVAIQGSGNATAGGVRSNAEQFTLTRAWQDSTQQETYDILREEFDLIWGEEDYSVLCTPLNEKTLEHIHNIRAGVERSAPRLQHLTAFVKSIITDSALAAKAYPKIPEVLGEKPFKLMDHQASAIKSWVANEYKGILELATGSGKTITSIYAATRVYEARKRIELKTILIVAVPYIELAKQWVSNLNNFNIKPIECWDTRASWHSELKNDLLAYNMGAIDFISIVVVNRTLASDAFIGALGVINTQDIVFIGDECHRHGGVGVNKALPQAFYRMGLSATPFNGDDEEYDNPFPDEAKGRLKAFYGGIVASYTLGDAINDGVLCEYDYHIVAVHLTQQEQELFEVISFDIGKLIAIQLGSGLSESQKTQFNILSGRRSRLLGGAENKLVRLRDLVEEYPSEKRAHSLFYCGEGAQDKELREEIELDEKIIKQVSRVLNDAGWSSSRFTSKETSRARKIIMRNFVDTEVDALVSLKVLDEGVDVPVCNKAFILASTRNPRQYVQRRGRVLRPHPSKSKSIIYDFVVLPAPGAANLASETLVKAELARVDNFCMLARNRKQVEDTIDKLGMRNE
jgi:superfamily II DNA or RNA helicase